MTQKISIIKWEKDPKPEKVFIIEGDSDASLIQEDNTGSNNTDKSD